MASIINTNIPSLTAQRNLAMSQTSLATSMQRLSSGLRINSAKDDAAGLAISERFTTQIRGLNQATRNANDGISLAQTGEGALAAVTDNMQRIRELAVQSVNATNSAADRIAINLEVQQRLIEIDRTASQTSFNGTKLLDGSFASANFQIGANAGEVISVALTGNTRLSATGAIATTDSGVLGAGSSGRLVLSPSTRNFGTAAVSFAGGTNSVTTATTNFGVAASSLSSGSVSFTAIDNNFQGAIGGKSQGISPTNFDFSAGSAAIVGKAVMTSALSDTAYLGAGNAVQFDVKIGAAVAGITLNQDYASQALVAAALQTQIQAQGGVFAAVTVTEVGGKLSFNNVGSATAIEIQSADTNAVTASFNNTTGVAGAAAAAPAVFTLDGAAVTLNTNTTDINGFVSALNTAIGASAIADKANLTASVVNGSVVVTRGSGSATPTAAVNITVADAKSVASGIVLSTGVTGTASSNPTSLTIGGTAVTLDENYGSYTNMAAAISTQLGANYVVTADANGDLTLGDFKITRVDAGGAGSAAIDITGDAASNTAGITTAGVKAGIAGTALVATTNTTFTVGSTSVTLNSNYADQAAVLAGLQSQLTGYNVTRSGNVYSFQSLTSSDAVAVGGIDAAETAAIGAGFVNSAGTVGTAAVSTTNATFTIDGFAITLDANYASFDAMAAAIDSKMETANPAADGQYTVTNNNGALTIARTTTGLASTAVGITVADTNATAAGFTVQGGTAGAAGVGAVTTTNLSINGTVVSGTFADATALATEINNKVSGVYARVDSGTNVMTLSSAAEIVLAGSDVATLGLNGAVVGTVAASSGSLSTANVLTADAANTTIQRIDAAMSSVSNLRSTFGAIQNRFESVITSLSTTTENLSASRSRIMDADFAQETANLSRSQILQQAGTAMVAQANQLPQGVLALLRQ